MKQTEELAALEEVVAARRQEDLDLDEHIALLHARQHEWLENNPDAREMSPYFDLLCDLEDLRDIQHEHLAVLSALAAQRGYRAVTEAPELAVL